MRIFLILSLFLWSLSGCDSLEFEEVEFVSMDSFEVKKIEGRNADMEATVTLFNPNFFGIKIKPSDLDVYVNDVYAGKVFLQEKVKLKKKTEAAYLAKLRLEGDEGILLRLMGLMRKKEVEIELRGKVTGSVYGISKKVEVNEKKVVETKKLKEKLPF